MGNTLLCLEVGWCAPGTGVNPSHPTQSANLAFQGYSGDIAWAQTHGPSKSSHAKYCSAPVFHVLFLVLEQGRDGDFLTWRYRRVGGASSRTHLYGTINRSLPLSAPYFLHLCNKEVGIYVPKKASITHMPRKTLSGPSGLCEHSARGS